VGKTDVSFTSRRPQQLAPSTLTSPCLYQRAMPCYSQAWLRLVAGSVRFFTSRSSSTLPKTRPLPIYSIYIKAKAVPVAASSSELASAGPTRSELRPRSLTALRIQLSSKRRTISAFPIIHARASPGPAETVSCSHHHTGESASAATDSFPRLPPPPGPSFAGDRGYYHRLERSPFPGQSDVMFIEKVDTPPCLYGSVALARLASFEPRPRRD